MGWPQHLFELPSYVGHPMGAWFVAQTGFEGPTDSLSIGHEQQVFLPHLESHAARSTLTSSVSASAHSAM